MNYRWDEMYGSKPVGIKTTGIKLDVTEELSDALGVPDFVRKIKHEIKWKKKVSGMYVLFGKSGRPVINEIF